MIDIHTHIVPGIDDGSSSLEMSRKMLEEEIKQGVDEVILTPHVCIDHPLYMEKDKYLECINKFIEDCSDLPIKLYPGQEIYYKKGTFEAFKQNKFLPLGNTDHYLVEFSMASDFEDIETSVYNLICSGYKIILAHPERYLYMDEELMYKLKEVGCLFQMNTSSILGLFGRSVKKNAIIMLKNGYVDFVASDTHGLGKRSPNLGKTLKLIEKKYKVKIDNKFDKLGV